MSLSLAPIRLIMFTSEDCVYCPPVEEIVMEIVGSGMQDLVHVSTIDVDVNPEAKEDYSINALPTLVVNDEIVLQGGMDDDTVRDLLWSRLLNQAVSSEKAAEQTTSALLAVIMNAMDSLNGSKLLRPSVGDYTHMGNYQLNLLSLHSLDPLVPYLLYRAGYQLGLVGMMHHILTLLNPKLGRTPKKDRRFKHLAYALELYFTNQELLPTYLAESAKVIAIDERTIVLQVNQLASASIRVDVGEPLCGFTAGQLAGVTRAVMGIPTGVEEIECMANGGEYCVFKILTGTEKEVERPLPQIENRAERFARRQNFYEVIHEVTAKIEQSLLMQRLMRPRINDYIHISVFQPIIVALKLVDRFSGSILFSGGRELGVFGPGKDLLYRLVQMEGVKAPVPFRVGINLLVKYLTHPTSLISRDYGRILLHEVDGGKAFILEVEENASVAGLTNAMLGRMFCDFQAGFFAGRLHIMIGLDPMVKEIECQGAGFPSCKFKITVK